MKLAREISICCIGIVMMCATCARAQPAAQSLAEDLDRVEQLQIRAENARNGPGVLDELIEARQQLIGLHPSDERISTWLLDQASDEMRRLSIYATDSTVLLGMPTDDQRSQVRTVSQGVVSLVSRARKKATTIADQYDQLSELTALQEANIDQIKGLDLPIRIPYLESRALLLLAASDVTLGASSFDARETARGALGALNTFTVPPSGAEIARRTNVAIANLLLGTTDSVSTASNTLASIDELISITSRTSKVKPDLATSVELALAKLVVSELSSSTSQLDTETAQQSAQPTAFDRLLETSPFNTTQGPKQVYRVLAYDTRTRWLMSRAALSKGNASVYDALVSRACSTQTMLLKDSLAIDPELLRTMVAGRLRTLTSDVTTTSVLPPLAEFCALGQRTHNAADLTSAAQAMSTLAARPDAGDVRPHALWETAVLLQRAHQRESQGLPDASIDLLASLAFEFPEHELAVRALGAVLPALAQRAREAEAVGEASSAASDMYARALDLASKSPGIADADYWQFERARTLLDNRPQWDTENLQRAKALLVSIDGASRVGTSAKTLYIATVMDQLSQLDPALPDDAHAVAATATEAITQLDQWLEHRDQQDTPEQSPVLGRALVIREIRAHAWLTLHDDRAVDELDSIASLPDAQLATLPGRGWQARVLLARALLEQDQLERAFATARDIASALDADPKDASLAQRPVYFWQAWETMMRVLALRIEHDPDTRVATLGTMRTHLLRLGQIDPAMGGQIGDRIKAIVQTADSDPN